MTVQKKKKERKEGNHHRLLYLRSQRNFSCLSSFLIWLVGLFAWLIADFQADSAERRAKEKRPNSEKQETTTKSAKVNIRLTAMMMGRSGG